MARASRAQSRGRGLGRRMRGRRGMRREPAAPRTLTIFSHMMSTILQVTQDISGSVSAWSKELTVSGLLSENTLAHYSKVFKQIKIHKLVCHYVPYAPMDTPGEYIFSVTDAGQIETASEFNYMVGAPGTNIRKAWQPSRGIWIPTEPDDRNWMLVSSNHIVALATVVGAESKYTRQFPNYRVAGSSAKAGTLTGTLSPSSTDTAVNINGKLITELHCSFRGRPNMKTFDSDLQARIDNCVCSKCCRHAVVKSVRREQYERDVQRAESNSPVTQLVDGFVTVAMEGQQ